MKTCTLFGFPFNNSNMEEMVANLLETLDNSKGNNKPRYVSTVNVNFICNVHNWLPGKLRNPEVFEDIRRSAMITPDGMPIVLLNHLLGGTLSERVSGSDLTLELVKALAKREGSVFILGGDETVARDAAALLECRYPGIKIGGIACPKIHISGEALGHSRDRDRLIVEIINDTTPDLLLICLGHPKQEIWFDRVRNQLNVPISMGVGGTLNFIAGNVNRAPAWMRQSGLEWMYRVIQEPGRLWRRYLYDGIKFCFISAPLVTLHFLNLLLSKPLTRKKPFSKKNALFLSKQGALTVVPMPTLLDKNHAEKVLHNFREALSHDVVIIDFRTVVHMDLTGISLVDEIWREAVASKKKFYALGISWRVRWLFKVHRLWPAICRHCFSSPVDIFDSLHTGDDAPLFYDAIQQRGDHLLLSIFGQLYNGIDYEGYLLRVIPMLEKKQCSVDLSYCTLIDNGGIRFLMQMKERVLSKGGTFEILGVSADLKRQLKLVDAYELIRG